MRKLILRISLSLDGFIEAGDGKIDFAKSRSPEGAAWIGEKMAAVGAHLLGRKAFCKMAQFWAKAPAEHAMNKIPKIVFSRAGFDPAQGSTAPGWTDAKVASGDLAEEIAALKSQAGKDLLAHGGIAFAQNLVQTGLVDEYWLAAGSGAGLFEKLAQPLYLKLVENKVFPTGAMVNIYRPE